MMLGSFRFGYRLPLIFVIGAVYSGTLMATPGLQKLYEEARQSDPQYLAAQADRKATETLIIQAGGQFLPQLSASGSKIKNETDSEQSVNTLRGPVDRTTRYSFHSKSASLNLNLAIFRPQLWASLAQAQAQVRQSEGALLQAEQDLIVRVSQAYFDVLLAEDTVKLYKEQKLAISERLKQAKRYFEAGVGTVTDINEAQARFDVIVAQELSTLNNLEVKRRALEATVGRYYDNVQILGDGLQLDLPVPATFTTWQEFAMKNNPQLKAREAALEVSQQEVYKNAAAHLPTMDFVANRSRQENPGYTILETTNWNTSFGIQVNIPIFSGGTTQGRVMQTQYNRDRVSYELESAGRAVALSVRQEYLNVINGVSQVSAYKQAVKSNELALYSAQRGQEAGVRTSFDVLNAQGLLYSAKRDLAEARYAYVMARLKLRAAAGLLGPEDVSMVQTWLVEKPQNDVNGAAKQQ